MPKLRKNSAFVALTAMVGIAAMGAVACDNVLPKAPSDKVSYFAAHFKVRAQTEPPRVYEVKQADKFPALRSTWNNAVLHVPEQCNNETANSGTGAGKGSGKNKGKGKKGRRDDDEGASVKLVTQCGFWLSELERGLVQNKFTVASWTSLRDLERTKSVPAYVAARDLGADVVFIINSLEAEPVHLGEEGVMSFDVFETDEDGHASRKLPLSKEQFEPVRAFVKARTKDVRAVFEDEVTHITATLDLSAVDTKTGESVWFYRKQVVEPTVVKLDRYFLFVRDNEGFWPMWPRSFDLAQAEEDRRSRASDDSRDHERFWYDYKAPPENAFEAQANALARSVVADFLQRFRGG